MNNDFWILLFNNLNWIAPLSITVIFSVLNIVLAIINLKMAKNQAKLQKDAFCYQLYDRRMGFTPLFKRRFLRLFKKARYPIRF